MPKEFTHNRLCILEKVINPWIVQAKCIIRKETFRIHLKEQYPLNSTLLGQKIYFDGEVDEPTKQIMFATCYQRDENGCINFIQKKKG